MKLTDFNEKGLFPDFYDLLEYLKSNSNVYDLKKYFYEKELQKKTGPPAVYHFLFNEYKHYIGKTTDIFQRLNQYFTLTSINTNIKDDLMMEMNKFSIEIRQVNEEYLNIEEESLYEKIKNLPHYNKNKPPSSLNKNIKKEKPKKFNKSSNKKVIDLDFDDCTRGIPKDFFKK